MTRAWTLVLCAACTGTAGDKSASDSGDAPTSTAPISDTPPDPDTQTTPEPTTPEPTATGDTAVTDPGRDYSSDRELFFGDSRCDRAGVWLCDGFEAGAIDTATWTDHPWAAAPVIDATTGARGSASLHFHVESNGFGALVLESLFPVPDDAYWGRLFVWFDAMPTAPSWAHWTIVGAAGPDVAGEIRVGGQYDPYFGANRWGVGSDGGATGDWMFLDDDEGPVATQVGAWTCIEWHHDATTDETRFYWDAVEHPSLATTADVHGGDQGEQYLLPGFDSVWIGWWLYQAYPQPDAFDVWIDEVAFDGERIGCVL